MAFRLTTFDGVNLPVYNAMFDFGTPVQGSLLTPTMNGSIDYYGVRRRIMHSQIFEVDAMTEAESLAAAPDNVRTIKELVGRTGWLVRVDTDGGSLVRRYCRLLGVSLQPRATQRGVINKLTLRFETNQPFWYSNTLTTVGPTAISSGSNINLTIAGEEDVLDAVLTITATANISSITIEHDKTEGGEIVISELDYTDTLLNTHDLVIDCGQYTVKDDGANAYDGFSLDSTHNEVYWLRLPAGSETMEITLGSGSGTYTLEYYAAYQ